MSVGITSIALFTPIIASNAVFSARRATRGVDAVVENPLYAAMNFDIAAAQTLKGARALKGLAVANNTNLTMVEQGAKEVIKNTSKFSKILNSAGKVISFTADYINPIICVAGLAKVSTAENKLEEARDESIRLGCMFGTEKAMKTFVGMPYTERVNGKIITKNREGFYKKMFNEKQLDAISDFCKTKKMFKYAPALKGILFVGASIAGYQFGDKLTKILFGKDKTKQAT